MKALRRPESVGVCVTVCPVCPASRSQCLPVTDVASMKHEISWEGGGQARLHHVCDGETRGCEFQHFELHEGLACSLKRDSSVTEAAVFSEYWA